MIVHFQASPTYLYDFLHKSDDLRLIQHIKSAICSLFHTHRDMRIQCSKSDVPKTLQTTVRALSLVKTGVGAGQIVFLRPKIRSLFVERNAFFSELDFHAILPCVIFVVFYVILNSPGLRRQGSSGESEARQHNENPRPTPLPGKTNENLKKGRSRT